MVNPGWDPGWDLRYSILRDVFRKRFEQQPWKKKKRASAANLLLNRFSHITNLEFLCLERREMGSLYSDLDYLVDPLLVSHIQTQGVCIIKSGLNHYIMLILPPKYQTERQRRCRTRITSYKKYSLRPGREVGTCRWSSLTALNSLKEGLRSSPISQTEARFPHR